MDLFFSQRSDFQISRLCSTSSIDQVELIENFRFTILEQQCSYPEIDRWLEDKVMPQLNRPDRIAFLAILDGKPVGAVVFKVSEKIKLCHLSVSEHARRCGIGEVLLGLLVLQLKNEAGKIYFTIPESVWDEQERFFRKFGFECFGEATRQYRLFDRELYCSASFTEFAKIALRRLGILASELNFGVADRKPTLLLSVKPKFARSILEGKKTIEIRRKFSKRWVGHRLAIYASFPEQSVVGEATIDMIDVGTVEEIWKRYAYGICSTKEEFTIYSKRAHTVCAIGLKDVTRFDTPLKKSSMVSIFGEPVRPPQSYFLLRDGKPWSCAVSLASTLGKD